MKAKLAVVSGFAAGIAAGFIVGCQTYDFEPVEPLALAQVTQTRDVVSRNLKPNVMLLVDKSASMDDPVDPANPKCQRSGGGVCGGTKSTLCNTNPTAADYCPTRWSELQGAMSDFLTNAGTVARLGMGVFPVIYDPGTIQGLCGLPPDQTQPSGVRVKTDLSQSDDVPTELQQQADTIKAQLLAITSDVTGKQPDDATFGGTPTGASLRELAKNSKLNDPLRQNFVLVLTDGLPNCNPNNTESTCACATANPPCATGTLSCRDNAATVAEVDALRAKNIRTIVVGFGRETGGTGNDVLNEMAKRGGLPRECPNGTTAECGGDPCDTTTRLCTPAFYQTQSRSQLVAALAEIGRRIETGDPCLFVLEAVPSDPRLVSVLIDGVNVASGTDTWTYLAPPPAARIQLNGAVCERVRNATPTTKVRVEIRVLQGL
jgi:hypothetical protein